MQLTVENGTRAGTLLLLERQRPLTIGSDPDRDLVLEESGVAGQHAVIKALRGEGFGIKALAGGVRVNGEEVQAAPLRAGDRIEVGGVRLAFGGDDPLQGSMLRGYRLQGRLGRGGMGVVYRAEQVSLGREVALKVLNKELTEDSTFIGRFVAEARAAARLHHPNVVQVFDIDHEEDTYFYPMELMVVSVETLVRQEGKLDPDRAVGILADAARGLSYAESLGIVHGDIKPDNIMLDRHGTAKLCDLGLAHTDESEGKGTAAGTPHFMAPEQALRKPIDHRTDIYALGCTFYRMLTGRTPFRGRTVKDILRAQVREEPEPAHRVDPEVPAELWPILQHMLAKDPDERYGSADELLADVEELLAPPSRRGLWLTVTGAAVIAASVAGWFAFIKEPVTIKEEKVITDPAALEEIERLEEELRVKGADNALLRLELRHHREGLRGHAFADALDELARAHPDTGAAERARARAEEVRAAVRRRERERERHRAAVATAVEELEREVGRALEGRAWQQALERLDPERIPEELRGEEEIRTARERLRGTIDRAAQQRLAALREPLQRALEQSDPEGLEAAVTALAGIVVGENAWPSELIPDRDALVSTLEEARAALEQMRAARRRERLAAGWRTLDEAIGAEDGIPGALRALDPDVAAEHLRRALADLDAHPAVDHGNRLARVLDHAAAFLGRLEQTVGAGEVLLTLDEGALAPVVAFRPRGPEAGVVVQTEVRRRERERRLPLDDLTSTQWSELTAKAARNGPDAERLAFLTVVELRRILRAGRGYLQRIDPGDDSSGTGEQAFAIGLDGLLVLLQKAEALDAETDWHVRLRAELEAAHALVRGLLAFSEQRNRAAAAHLDRVLEAHPHSVVVVALR